MRDEITNLERLHEVGEYDLTNPRLRSILDRICWTTARQLDFPTALVTIVLNDAEMYAGTYGLDGCWNATAGGVPIEWAFCPEMVRTGRPFIWSDLRRNPRHRDNPRVRIEGIRCYVGVPLVSNGKVIGGHCLTDTRPRRIGRKHVDVLLEAATRVIEEISSFRLSLVTSR
jgi:GAF domain-containing protein